MTQFTKRDISEALAAQQESAARVIIFSLTGCAPCEVVKQAVAHLCESDRLGEFEAIECLIDRDDKKALGKAFLSGTKVFPTVRIVHQGRLCGAYNSVPPEWTHLDVARFLEAKVHEAVCERT